MKFLLKLRRNLAAIVERMACSQTLLTIRRQANQDMQQLRAAYREKLHELTQSYECLRKSSQQVLSGYEALQRRLEACERRVNLILELGTPDFGRRIEISNHAALNQKDAGLTSRQKEPALAQLDNSL